MSIRDTHRVVLRRRIALFTAAASSLALGGGHAFGQTVTNWTGASGSYIDPSNWSNGVPSLAADSIALIGNTGTVQVTGTDAAEAGILLLGQQPGQNGNVTINGGTLSTGEIRVGG